jgi:hypothetical protein
VQNQRRDDDVEGSVVERQRVTEVRALEARPARQSMCRDLQQCGTAIDADNLGAALDKRHAERARSAAGVEHPAPRRVPYEAEHSRTLVVRVPRVALVVPRICCRERVVVGLGTPRHATNDAAYNSYGGQ